MIRVGIVDLHGRVRIVISVSDKTGDKQVADNKAVEAANNRLAKVITDMSALRAVKVPHATGYMTIIDPSMRPVYSLFDPPPQRLLLKQLLQETENFLIADNTAWILRLWLHIYEFEMQHTTVKDRGNMYYIAWKVLWCEIEPFTDFLKHAARWMPGGAAEYYPDCEDLCATIMPLVLTTARLPCKTSLEMGAVVRQELVKRQEYYQLCYQQDRALCYGYTRAQQQLVPPELSAICFQYARRTDKCIERAALRA